MNTQAIWKTELEPYQKQAVSFLMRKKVGACYMDMGLGKTRVAFEMFIRRREASKVDRLVYVTPASLMLTVKAEWEKHLHLDQNEEVGEGALLTVFSVEGIGSSARILFDFRKRLGDRVMLVLDESHYCKGFDAKRSKRIAAAAAHIPYKLNMTGTPMPQGLVDHYAQFAILDKRILGYNSFYGFERAHIDYHLDYPGMVTGYRNPEAILERIAPFTYQVTREEVIDLPEVTRSTVWTSMTKDQEIAYAKAKRELLFDVPDPSSIDIFKLFTTLQRILSGEWPEEGEAYSQNRIAALIGIVRSIGDAKGVIWAKFHSDIERISKSLADENVTFAVLTGEKNEKEKALAIDSFRENAQFLIATPATGGIGLTLNEAKFMIHYTSSFKRSERDQAEARNHRIGQKSTTHVYEIVCLESIDERIKASLDSKGCAIEDFRSRLNQRHQLKSPSKELACN